MTSRRLLCPLALAFLTSGLAVAQNDECSTAMAIGLGTTAFDTTGATLSPEVWPCAVGGAPDLWYTYTATSDDDILIETCGSSYDTALETFTGACGALAPMDCNDDACGLQSALLIRDVSVGEVYTFRVGGFNGETGLGALTVVEQPPPPQPPPITPGCVETLFAADSGGAPGGTVYFDVTAVSPVDIGLILTNFDVGELTSVGIEVFTTPGSYVGNETNASAWTLAAVDNGGALAAGFDGRTVIELASPFTIPTGTSGVALVAVGAGHLFTIGTGANQTAVSMDGNLSLDLGAATNGPLSGDVVSPRIWNGRLCPVAGPPIGSSYCSAIANSTGAAASISATGSSAVIDDDVTLTASGMPAMQLGLFATSDLQAATPVASGTLCLGGSVLRFQGPGQILQSDANGEFALRIDTTALPAGLPRPILPGETWNFTAWFQDVDPVTGTTANFTDGISITFS